MVSAVPLTSITFRRLRSPATLLEFVIIIVVGVFATLPYANFDPSLRLAGIEAEYLTRTSYSLATLLPEHGYIPLWQPYMEFGDPMLENPVSFAFNPIATWPSMVFGPYNGIKITIILSAILAGFGGWAMGRVLGLGMLARMLLAVLCIGKGNMHAFLSQGHFALFLTQSYFPWIFMGVVAILRGYKRWPLVLVVISFALVFWSGIPWYPPALVLMIGILTLFGVIELRSTLTENGVHRRLHIQWSRLFAVSVSLVVTLCLSAVTMLPLFSKRDNIGASLIQEDFRANALGIFGLLFNGIKDRSEEILYPRGYSYSYYSYVSPLWYVVFLLLLLLAVVLLRRKLPALQWRILAAASVIVVFCTLWGSGQNPIIELFYQIIPLANQFRHVSRVLAVSSFWMIVIIALIVDVIWRDLVQIPLWAQKQWLDSRMARVALRVSFGALLLLASVTAAFDVVRQWHLTWGEAILETEEAWEDYCITWLRDQYPERPLSVWTLHYQTINTYLRNRVRHGWVSSDFYHPRPIDSTLFIGSLVPVSDGPPITLPEFAMGITHYDDAWAERNGYTIMPESANPYAEGQPCFYRREGAYSYAWWAIRADLDRYMDFLPVEVTHPITQFRRDYDRITLLAQAQPDADVAVTVQELAYPGWSVSIDGVAATLESLGGQVAVVLPRSDSQHVVAFQYLPRRFFTGAIITLITVAVLILYLLRVDRRLPRLRLRFGSGALDGYLARLDPVQTPDAVQPPNAAPIEE